MKKIMTEEKKREVRETIEQVVMDTVDKLNLGLCVFNTIIYTGRGLYNVSEGNYGRVIIDGLVVGASINRFTSITTKRELDS